MLSFLISVWASLTLVTYSMNPQQAYIAHQIMKARNAPPWAVIVDSVQLGTIAFTDTNLEHVYIDASRLRRTPRTFANILVHEVGHLNGAIHGDGSLGMNYSVTEKDNENISEDDFLLMPGIDLLG